jgi:hypothetical protein
VTSFTRSPLVARPAVVVVAVVVAATVALTGCTAPPSRSASPTAPAVPASPAPSVGPTASAVPAGPTASSSPSAAAVGQTDTDWGRIWDVVPASFPRYPGTVSTETGAGPTSGEFSVPTDAKTAAAAMQSALEAAAYSTEAQSGPLEDGSIVIDSIGENAACRVQTRLAPLGSTTLMTVLYGAACPAP